MMKLVLASKSPRRRELLRLLGVDFTVFTADTDEHADLADASELAEELAFRKARDAYAALYAAGKITPDTVVLGCDTVVHCGGEIFGKPRGRADAERMLRALSGREHTVTSGVALLCPAGALVRHEMTAVIFDTLSNGEISAYLDTDEPYDKAGAYGIQGYAARFVSGIRGCYFNVVGLPVHLLYRMLEGFPAIGD